MNQFRRKARWRDHWTIETWQWSDIKRQHPEFIEAIWPDGITDSELMSRQDPDAWGWDIVWSEKDVHLNKELEKTREILAVLGEDRERWSKPDPLFTNRQVYGSLLGIPVEAGGRGPGSMDWRTTEQAARTVAEGMAKMLWAAMEMGRLNR